MLLIVAVMAGCKLLSIIHAFVAKVKYDVLCETNRPPPLCGAIPGERVISLGILIQWYDLHILWTPCPFSITFITHLI